MSSAESKDTDQNETGAASATATLRKGRYEFLDVARAVAALMVVFQHSMEVVFPAFARFTLRYFSFGTTGVVVFFGISGFIIPVSLERAGSLRRFWIVRIARLYPLYWFSLFMALAFGAAGLIPMPAFGSIHYASFVTANLTMFQELFRMPHAIGLYWTLGLEMIFYILCSILFAIDWLKRKKLMAWLSALACTGATLAVWCIFHRSFAIGRALLIVGAFGFAYLNEVFGGRQTLKGYWVYLGLLLSTVVLGAYVRYDLYPVNEPQRLSFPCVVFSWICGLTILMLFFSMRRVEFPKFSIQLGVFSYSLYLLHPFAIALLPHTFPPVLWVALVILSSVMVSFVTWRFIEKPGIALGRKISEKLAVS